MFKKLIGSGLGIVFLASPLLVSADTLSDLMAQMQALQAQIAALKTQITVQASAPKPPTPRGCPSILRNLVRGMRGDDVLKLQAHLGVSQTGYFGPATEAAVQNLQVEVGIAVANAGPPAGFGQIGPRTRAAIAARCGAGNVTFSAGPISGVAPLTVTFTAKNLERNSNFVVYFGTTECEFGSCGQSIRADSPTVEFTYKSPGTYIAMLKNESNYTLGTATISVGSTGVPSVSILSPTATSTAQPGSRLAITWGTQNAPIGAKVNLLLVSVVGGPWEPWIKIGTDQEVFGDTSWTIPWDYCYPLSCGLPLKAGRYFVRASLMSNGQSVATAESGIFTITTP